MTHVFTPQYGRLLGDFRSGDTYLHPWEVTVDDGMRAMWTGSFLDATPVFASRDFAQKIGFRDRPLSPLLLLNLGLSFSVHDVSEQAIAHLAYLDVSFPEPAYAGDTLWAWSTVLEATASKSGDKGVVHVRTVLQNQNGACVCSFRRKALVRAGTLTDRPVSPVTTPPVDPASVHRLPAPLREGRLAHQPEPRFAGFFEDMQPGDVFAHAAGRTVGESEHMQLTMLCRNSHPLHFDAQYCRKNSFTEQRVVYGGLVLGWVLSLTSRDVAGNAVWEMGLDDGAHPAPTLAGDTLFAASRVESKQDLGPDLGAVTFRVVGVKNAIPREMLASGADLFTPELGKKAGKIPEKVVEITRTLVLRKRSSQ